MAGQSKLNLSSPLAMHPALTTHDVICTISSHTEHGSLPALASTCRAFEHPALNVLWRDLQSVGPLVRCLPNDLFGIDEGCMVLEKPMDGKMWNTVFKYTSRVHSITVTQSDFLTFLEPLNAVMLSCPSTPASLFPNLRKLTWHPESTLIYAEFLHTILVPSMSILDVWIPSTSPALLSVLSSLGTKCPHLQHMTINGGWAPDDKRSLFITQSISQLHHLRTLSVWDLGTHGIKHVMQLRALQSLSLNLESSSAWDTWPRLQYPGFHDLKLLGLSTRTVVHASNFLSSLQVVRSKEIKVHITSQVKESLVIGDTTLSRFFAVLQKRCDNDKLEYFSLIGCSRVIHTALSVFKPLHACHNLTRLVIETVCPFSMSDEELCQLVRAWPKLQVLKINCCIPLIVPTFHGLISLLRLCPALTSLALVVDTTKVDGVDLERPGGESCNKHLTFLALGNSPIDSPLNVALILSGLFPYLKQVNFDCCHAPPKRSAKEQWDSVNSFLGGFSVVRRRGKLEA